MAFLGKNQLKEAFESESCDVNTKLAFYKTFYLLFFDSMAYIKDFRMVYFKVPTFSFFFPTEPSTLSSEAADDGEALLRRMNCCVEKGLSSADEVRPPPPLML